MKTEILRARIEPELKETVEKLLSNLGLTTTDAIRIFFKQIELTKGLPFAVKLPNEETIETFKATDKGEDLTHCKDAENMFERLNI